MTVSSDCVSVRLFLQCGEIALKFHTLNQGACHALAAGVGSEAGLPNRCGPVTSTGVRACDWCIECVRGFTGIGQLSTTILSYLALSIG